MRSIVYGDILLPDHPVRPVSYYDVNKTNGAAEQSRPGLTDSDTFLCLVERFVFFPHGESVDVLLRFLT